MKNARIWIQPLFALVGLLLLSGCATNAMKGTPFYSGDYDIREGAAEERVNIWPLFYHRSPATSILWPIGEWTDDHAAIRPLFSVYGMNRDGPNVYNILRTIIMTLF